MVDKMIRCKISRDFFYIEYYAEANTEVQFGVSDSVRLGLVRLEFKSSLAIDISLRRWQWETTPRTSHAPQKPYLSQCGVADKMSA